MLLLQLSNKRRLRLPQTNHSQGGRSAVIEVAGGKSGGGFECGQIHDGQHAPDHESRERIHRPMRRSFTTWKSIRQKDAGLAAGLLDPRTMLKRLNSWLECVLSKEA